MKFLKRFGLHHGLVTLVTIALADLLSSSGLAALLAGFYMIGVYVGREVKEAELRAGTGIEKDPAAVVKRIEWPDWITPALIALIYFWLRF